MEKTKTKKALFMSVLSMVLCIAMLIGMTFAWFTDTASTGVNKIQAGNLDVQLLMRNAFDNYENIGDSSKVIFGAENSLIAQNNNQDTLWEPGKTQVAYLAVRNAGNLALKYNIVLNIKDSGLADALQYAIVPQQTLTGESQNFTETVGSWSSIAPGLKDRLPKGKVTAAPNGCLDAIANDSTKVNETEYFALVVHMDEAAGNKYQGKSVDIDVTVVATQKDAEYDSNGNDYDKDVDFPVIDNKSMNDAVKTGGTVNVGTDVKTDEKLNLEKDVEISLAGNTWTVGDNTKLLDGADLKVSNGTVKSTSYSGYIGIRPGSTTHGVIEYTNVKFVGEYNKGRGTRGSSTTHTDYVLKYTPEAGGHAKLVFKNCTFENAAVQFSGLSGKDGTFEAIFEGCTFKGLTNSKLIEVGSYLTDSCITIKNCSFDITATSNFSVIDGNYGRAATVNFEGSNSFTGVVATPTGADKQRTSEEIKIFSENLNVKVCSAKTINGLDTVTVSGIITK